MFTALLVFANSRAIKTNLPSRQTFVERFVRPAQSLESVFRAEVIEPQVISFEWKETITIVNDDLNPTTETVDIYRERKG